MSDKKLYDLFSHHSIFAKREFPDSTWQSSLKGLQREINEVAEAMTIGTMEEAELEYVDCFMYLIDSMSRAGISIPEFKTAFEKKLEINKNRDWEKNDDGSYSHVK